MPKNNDIQDVITLEEPTVAKTTKTSNTFLIAGVSAAAAALLAGSAAFAIANPASPENFRPHDGNGPTSSQIEGAPTGDRQMGEPSREGSRGHGPRHEKGQTPQDGGMATEMSEDMHNDMDMEATTHNSDHMPQGDMKQFRQGSSEVTGEAGN